MEDDVYNDMFIPKGSLVSNSLIILPPRVLMDPQVFPNIW